MSSHFNSTRPKMGTPWQRTSRKRSSLHNCRQPSKFLRHFRFVWSFIPYFNTGIHKLSLPGMFDIWPVMNKCTVVAKRELFYAWPFGLAAWLCGLIFIDRMQSDKARNSLCDATDLIKQKKIKLWIFPEGTRRNTGEIHSFKKGAFHMAIAGQIPILPVVFSSYKTFLDDDNKNMTSGKCSQVFDTRFIHCWASTCSTHSCKRHLHSMTTFYLMILTHKRCGYSSAFPKF